ncbi:hypothetical protein [Flavobacterium sp.]|uniref:hypothetical protein n=1 Tax=Flavobacterium sp. TaxID=239 RepID=UPI00261267A1|nr:hypothetical protein [Flavobacterium sp.]
MKIEYKLKQEDYKNALIELLRKEFWKRIIAIFLIPLIISLIIAEKSINWKIFIITFLISFFGIIILLFGKSLFNIYKTDDLIKENPLYIGETSIFLEDDGIIFGKENPTKYDWSLIKSIEDLTNYIIVILENNTSITINKKELKNEEIANIIGKIKSKIITSNTVSTVKKSRNIYWLGFLGLIPNIGLIIGIILSIIGLIRKDLKLIFIGVIDILFTIVFWTILTFIDNSDYFSKSIDKQIIEITQGNLNDLVKQIEFYKIAKGKYPEKLNEIKNKNSFIIINEIFETEKSIELYYKVKNDKYVLKSFGPDRKINTNDDIYPRLEIDSTKIGLRKKL